MARRLLQTALALLVLAAPLRSLAEIIPAARRVAWEGNVGVPGGIPARTNIRNCVTSDGAVGNGTADDTNAIRACITNTPADGVAYLPAGQYRITGGISITRSITLRGAGPAQTKIIANLTSGNAAVALGGSFSYSRFIAVNSGYGKASASLGLADASTINPGDYLAIVQNNDQTTTSITIQGTGPGGCTWCGFTLCSNDEYQPCDWDGLCGGGGCSVGGRVALGQIVKVTSKSGSTVNIEPPLAWAYVAAAHPRIMRLGPMLERAGVEGLFLDQPTSASFKYHFSFDACASCWLKNVESNYAINRHVIGTFAFRNEYRDSYFHHSDHYGQDHGYGIELGLYTTGTLIENNVFDTVVLAVNIERGSTGNVVAYNYSHHIEYTNDPDTQEGDFVTHGAHPVMNLFEGNVGRRAGHDNYWGSASHLTYLRNSLASPEPQYSCTRNPVLVDADNRFMNFVGNILGRPGHTYNGYELTGASMPSCYCGSGQIYRLGYYGGTGDCVWGSDDDPNVAPSLLRHGNYDYYNNTVVWDSAISDRVIPASYYLPGRPSWWTCAAWPSIGPDLNPMVGCLPAQARFRADGGFADAGTPFDAGTPADAGPAADSGPGQDAGPTPDSGSTVDAGQGRDAGTGGDGGGQADAAGTTDASSPADSGQSLDAGAPADGGGGLAGGLGCGCGTGATQIPVAMVLALALRRRRAAPRGARHTAGSGTARR